MMKQLFLFSMMWLSTMFAQAQVVTSEVVSKTYATMIAENDGEFFYNGEFDDKGVMTAKTVYNSSRTRKGQVRLEPVFYYTYEYSADGLLKSRTKYMWHDGQWRCASRYDYSLAEQQYTVSYSRWNKKMQHFDAVTEKMVYALLPDTTIRQISFYQRDGDHDSLQLAWQLPVTYLSNDHHFLTQK